MKRSSLMLASSSKEKKFTLEVENCGFVSWIDEEWPATLKHAICRLWGMYDDSNSLRIEERVENGKVVKELADEKSKLEKKYTSLLADAKKFMEETSKQVMEKNYAKIKSNTEEEVNVVEELKKELAMLKQVHKSQAEIMKIRQNKWEEEKEALKEEKKKLEYMIYDMLKASEGNKDKLKRIREICDE